MQMINTHAFPPDSPEAMLVIPARGWLRHKLGPRVSYGAIVVHTTGAGILKKAQRWKVSPIEAAARVFGTQIDTCAHYVVCGHTGDAIQTVPEERAAWHVGAAKSWRYAKPNWADGQWWKRPIGKDVLWWCEKWMLLRSPLQLANGHLWMSPANGNRTCNGNTIGIEVVPNVDAPRGPWTDACWGRLFYLIQDICHRRMIPLDREHVITHSDAHPITRTSRNQPWDPLPAQFSWTEWHRRVGAPLLPGL